MISGPTNGWYYVKLANGTYGYASASYVTTGTVSASSTSTASSSSSSADSTTASTSIGGTNTSALEAQAQGEKAATAMQSAASVIPKPGSDRAKAVDYAYEYCMDQQAHDGYVYIKTYGKSDDCTDFVSQCLHAGGLPESSGWYYHGVSTYLWYNPHRWFYDYEIDASASWMRPPDLLAYLTSTLGFHDYTISDTDQLHQLAKSGVIQPGDVAILCDSHAVIII